MLFDIKFIHNVLPDSIFVSGVIPEDPHFSVDTRTLERGDIFVPLIGKYADGHDFIQEAFAKGASGVIAHISHKKFLMRLDPAVVNNACILLVSDTLDALTTLARAWREQFTYPVVAVTGSVGKTSTKELLSSIMRKAGKQYLVSPGNQNTAIGISLTLLNMRSYHDGVLLEVGINKRNEMAKLARLAQPTTALITSVGHCHMEGLGTLQDIAQEKRDIFSCFSENSIGIVNGDQPLLAQVAYKHPVIKFGSKTTNQIQARKIALTEDRVTFSLKIYHKKYSIVIHKAHISAVFNALAAAAGAYYLGVPDDIIVQAIQEPVAVAGRFEQLVLKGDKGVIINDCYNANPESMKAALLAFERMGVDKHKIAVLGDMLELGINSSFWHRQLGRFLHKVPSVKHVILVGSMVQWTRKTLPLGVHVEHVTSWQEAIEKLQAQLRKDALVLVKASNGIGLGNLVNHLVQE